MLLDIGCYTRPGGAVGITTLRVDGGDVVEVSVTPTDSPSWLCPHPSLPIVYAANETGDGTVSVCRRATSGALEAVQSFATGGSFPCHLALDGSALYAANYGSGSVTVLALADDGTIARQTDLVEHEGSGPVTDRQEGPHVHQVVPGKGGTVRAVDLGTDQVVTYSLDGGRLTVRDVLRLPPGFGPRQLVDLPDGRMAVVGELASQLAMVDHGEVVDTSRATNQSTVQGNLPAQLTSHNGRLYVSNRGNDCVTTFDLDGGLRSVADLPVGRAPRQFAFADELLIVAAQDENAVELYRADRILARVPHPQPTFVLVSPDGITSPQGESVH